MTSAREVPMLRQERVYREFPASFATGEQGTFRLYFQKRTLITHVRGVVTHVIAGTDNGTITIKNSVNAAWTDGVITAAASDALATNYLVTPLADDAIISAGDYLQIVTAKTTAGGVVALAFEGYELPAS